MSIRRKIRVGWSTLRDDGPRRFLHRLFVNIRRAASGDVRIDESEIVSAVLKSVSNGVMIDVGAHYGASLDPFARRGWRVLAFEPDPGNRRKLEAAFGSWENEEIDTRGVSNQSSAKVPFYSSSSSTGISGLLAFHSTHQVASTIETTTLEQAIHEYGLNVVHFLKVDTEGLDLLVLQGLPHEVMPDVIVCEFEDTKTKHLEYSYADLGNELVRRGYIVLMSEWYPIRNYGDSHRWRRVVEWPALLEDEAAWGNFIAVKSRHLADSVLATFRARVGRSPSDRHPSLPMR